MTAQAREILYYNGETFGINTEPLESYFQLFENPFKFQSQHTACGRGYIGTWEIKNNLLLLIKFNAWVFDQKEVDINYLFPGEPVVFADWFSGEIQIPQGKELLYIHSGYRSIYEKDLFLKFKNGHLINSRTVDNYEKALQAKKENDELNRAFGI